MTSEDAKAIILSQMMEEGVKFMMPLGNNDKLTSEEIALIYIDKVWSSALRWCSETLAERI